MSKGKTGPTGPKKGLKHRKPNSEQRPDKVVHLNAFKDVDSASDQAIEWLARLRAEDVKDQEIGAFAEWLAASSEHKLAFDEALDLWDLSGSALAEFAHTLPDTNHSAIQAPKSDQIRLPAQIWQPLSVAAVFLMTCIVVLLQFQAPVYQTGKGEHRRVVLTDGSTAVLNTNTEIKVRYSGAERRIDLTHGEAWFDVRKDPQRPFVVNGEYASATAIGTAFTVRDETHYTRISVTEGVVAVDLADVQSIGSLSHLNGFSPEAGEHAESQADGKVHLNATEGIQVESETTRTLTVDLATEQAWQRGQLIYKDVSLTQLVDDLNRYLPVTLTINDADLAERKISAVLQLDDHAAMLDALSQVLPVKWKAVSDNLVILTNAG
ncbi:MAG: FecR domain-containing protein [Pseudomonadota bacterium]